ncbi:unnamed protein product [Notodromas monacha]|uniref:Aminotransferase class I/classII large domain-containing protein n=1 Tax=Notodromas monacha TaxID=399045 RepID=A0A7R9BFD2_9CRUS|nr:unnamed protein product [Notodromas monacha]CAG0913628.1 unnamed protein product [Notodromas monacha]
MPTDTGTSIRSNGEHYGCQSDTSGVTSGQELFESPPSVITDYSRFISQTSSFRNFSFPRVLMKCLETLPKDGVFFAGGLPNASLFPISNVTIELTDGTKIDFGNALTSTALQYGTTNGYPPLLQKLNEYLRRYHGIDEEKMRTREMFVVPGAQDGLSKAAECILNEGDYVILEKFMYPGTTGALAAMNPKHLTVESDGDGMIPESLLQVLSPWDGENARPSDTAPKDRFPSFLSMDVDNRVIRLDSFSKIVSAGMRLGCIIGPQALMERVLMHEQVTIMHTPGLTQIMLHKILESWGWEKFEEHVRNVTEFYKSRRDIMLKLCNEHLSDLAHWHEPRGGMFMWLKLKGIKDTLKFCMGPCMETGIVTLPGSACSVAPQEPSSFIRLSYSLVPVETMEKGIKRLREAILKEQARTARH